MKIIAAVLILLSTVLISSVPTKKLSVAGQPPRSAGRVDYSQPDVSESQPPYTLAGQPPRSAGRVD